tara:strand:+ start:735 stop:1502 length:768 start_codon:yes stop_codon:yes gene_type:complete
MKNPILKELYFSPVKSLSFCNTKNLIVKKNIGIKNDRIFAFTRIINEIEAKEYETNPNKRNLKFFLTLKNSPFLNKYNFELKDKELSLLFANKQIKKISLKNNNNFKILSEELKIRENLKNFNSFLIKNISFPFFDTMPHNSISLINLNSIKDFEKKINYKINHERFRGNIYINDIEPWSEFAWLDREIKINDCAFKVLSKIPRCSATNLPFNSDKADINLPNKLNEIYGHINMGVYLKPLNSGTININDKIKIL